LRLGIRGRLVIASIGVIVVSVVVAYGHLRTQLGRMFADQISADLSVRVDLVAMRVEQTQAPLEQSPAWDALARDLAKRGGARVTLIRADGAVLGDSELALKSVEQLERHDRRPEVVQALASGRGQSERYSATLGRRMHYAAASFYRAGRAAGVARMAMPLTQVDEAVAELRRVVAWATLLAVVLAVVLSSIAAHLVSRTALSLVRSARKMAEGDLSTRTGLAGHDELGQLGRSLDRMAQTLSSTVQRVREERDRLSGILSGMQEAVMMLDRAGKIALVNPALRELLLLDADAQGRSPHEVMQQPELVRLLTVCRSTAEPLSAEMELGGLKPRIVLVRAAPLAGEPGGVFCVLVDVTEMRRLESMRRDFVANVSHELRTPVTAIRSAAETLQSAMQHDPQAAEMFVEIIDRNAARLHGLVEDLLDLSRIESRELKLQFEELDLSELFGQVIDLFRERADKKHIRLASEIPAQLPHALSDRDALENILTNLVDNAVKYCGKDSEVRLRATQEGERIRVFVQDNGRGIAAHHLPRLFERFYRVDTGRSRELGGTGLGLSIVKHLAEALGGKVQVDSTPGVGTQFSFTVQRSAREPAAGEA
jgi:two-component system phosphate regulon sensor histidine kinase PhoR